MKTEITVQGVRLLICDDGFIKTTDEGFGARTPHTVGLSIDQMFETNDPGTPNHKRVGNLNLKPSEARTIASALMKAAQSVR